ncbi:outer membrane beta-barrel protein [Undibacterium sp. CY18W]|uniref:Outer membrane beta-barrel protein n=1 Tax=Undibacterium hunanense TaxID=2762292 RepID=A0ABR6ZU06_9BURK|nr:outer membrane beta-barrel protein [Undibacterium hunanense]MBC3919330.1 outer membrane beta-barrel protein [Undibacterium hunanense]
MKKLSLAIAAMAALTAHTFASAQAYTGATIGRSDQSLGCSFATTCDTKSNNFKVFGGYNIDKNFAVELAYFSLGSANYSYPASNSPYGNVAASGAMFNSKVKQSGVSLAAIYKLEFNESFGGFAKLGIANVKEEQSFSVPGIATISDSSFRSNKALFGLGLTYKLSPDWTLRAEAEKLNPGTFSGKGRAATNFNIGAQYNF